MKRQMLAFDPTVTFITQAILNRCAQVQRRGMLTVPTKAEDQELTRAATKEIDDFEDYLHVWISDLEEDEPVH